MLSQIEPLAALTAAALVVALIGILRSREADWPRIRWLVGGLVSLAAATLLMMVPEIADLPAATAPLRTALFLGSALFLMAFRHSFVAFHRLWWVVAASASLTALLGVAVTEPKVGMAEGFSPAQAGAVGLWAATMAGVGFSFWRLGSDRSPSQRARMRTLAVAIIGLAGGIGAIAATSVNDTLRGRSDSTIVAMLFAVGLLGLAIQPPRWLRRLHGGNHREQLRADSTRRISLATGRHELGEAAIAAAIELLGADGAFLVDDGKVIAAEGLTAADAERLVAWSAGDALERSVRIDDGPPVLVTIRRASATASLGVVAGAFSPVFGSDEGAQLEDLATTVGLALTRVQLFEDLRHETERSEQLLEAVSDLGEGVFVTDGDRFLEVNDALCRMLGMTRSELLRLPSLMELVPDEQRAEGRHRQDRFVRSLATGHVADRFETRVIRPDRRQLLTTVALRAIDTNEGPRIIGAIRDVTTSRRALRDQQRRAQHLAALRQLESTVSGLLDLDALVDTITEAVCELLECRVSAVALFDQVGDEPLLKTRGLDPEDTEALRIAARAQGAAMSLPGFQGDELDLRSIGLPDGHPFLGHALGVTIPSGDRVIGMLLVAERRTRRPLDDIERSTVRDLASYIAEITQTVRAFESERATVDELRRVDETRDLLLSAVSHDLRSPLSTISTMARTLELRGEQMEPDFRLELARRIYGQSTRLARVVTDLLDLDRLRRGMLEAERRPVPLSDVVHGALAGVERRALERVATDVDDVIVSIDGPKVERLIENLVANAIRHAGEDCRVWIQAHETGGTVRLIVEDDGPGVAAEDRERIFLAFERDTDNSRGFGLGLALVRRIAQLHGGTATAEERPGGGARFVVTLRHDRPDPVIDVTDDSSTPAEPDLDPEPAERRRPTPGTSN